MFLEGTMKRNIKTLKTKSIDKIQEHDYIATKYTWKPPAWNAEAILYKTTKVYVHEHTFIGSNGFLRSFQ